MPSGTPASGTAWTPTRTPSCSTTCGRPATRHGRSGSETGRRTPVPASALVTGGRGFVGAWLCRQLLERGDSVVSLDRGAREGRPSALELLGIDRARSPRWRATWSTPSSCRATLAEHDVDAVFHLAAQTIVGTAAESPDADLRDERPRHVDRARGVPRGGRGARGRRLLGQGVRRPRRAALPRGLRASADRAVRGEQGGRRPDRAQLLALLRAAGRGDPVREHLRRAETRTSAADPRGASAPRSTAGRRCSGPTAPRSATFSTSRTRHPPTWRSPTRSTATRCGARRSTPAAGAPMRSARWLG